jgi:ribosomal protein S18 acetylase RimI-like enzyme
MAIQQLDPADRRAVKHFVRLERKFLRSEPLHYWPEAESDVRKHISPESAFANGRELTLFVADGRARCAAIVNRRWQAEREPDTGFVGWFAAAPGAERVAGDVLAAAEEWLAARGVRRVIAPVNGSGMVGMAVLTDGFDESPMYPLPWNPPHYPRYLEAAGYAKAYPLYLYEVDLGSQEYRRAAERALAAPECTIRPIDKTRWSEELELFRRLFNDGFRDEWEMHTYDRAEFEELYDAFKPLVDPRLFIFAEVDGEPAGFSIGLPDWTPLFRSLRGRLGPLQQFRLLRGAKRFDRGGLVTIAIRSEFRGKRIGQTLAASIFGRLEQVGVRTAPYYLVNDVNTASRGLAKSFGGRERLLYHCYDKQLD